MPPPPPPAPGPPPPGKMPNKSTGARKDLLGSIEGFKKGKLKKTETQDKSGPQISAKPGTSSVSPAANRPSTGGSSGGGGYSASPSPALGGMGGIFAGGGMPKLRKTGLPGSSTMLPKDSNNSGNTSTPPQNNQPKAIPPSRPVPSVVPSQQQRQPPPSIPIAKAEPPKISPRKETGLSLVLVQYPFSAQRESDLSILPDDIIHVVNKNPPGSGNGNWWEGIKLSGERGHFPSNYVSVCYFIFFP